MIGTNSDKYSLSPEPVLPINQGWYSRDRNGLAVYNSWQVVYLCGGPFNPHSGALHQWRHIRPSHIFHESAYSYRAVRAFKFFDISRRISLKSPHKRGGELRKHWSKGRYSQTAMPFFAVFELYFGLFLLPVQNQMHRWSYKQSWFPLSWISYRYGKPRYGL